MKSRKDSGSGRRAGAGDKNERGGRERSGGRTGDNRSSAGRGEKRSDSRRDDRPAPRTRRDDRDERPRPAGRPRRDDDRKPFEKSDSRPARSRRDDNEDRRSSDRKPAYGRGERSNDNRGSRPDSRGRRDEGNDRRSSDRKPAFGRGESRGEERRDSRPDRRDDRNERPSAGRPRRDDDKKPFDKSERRDPRDEKRPYERKTYNRRDDGSGDRRESRPDSRGRRDQEQNRYPKTERSSERGERESYPKREGRSSTRSGEGRYDEGRGRSSYGDRKPPGKTPYRKKSQEPKEDDGSMRINRYLAHAGVCSRREADDLIQAGAVSVNGQVITELGYKIQPGDKVQYGGETLSREKAVYLLLNKPKDYITTTDDPGKRKTVLDLIGGACKERIYPVGRLDRNTTGVLLFTNDGELSKKLLHPKYGIRKIYQVTTEKNVAKSHLEELRKGVELEDGFVKVDEVDYVTAGSKNEIGIEIHSGKNRIIRRLMEHFGYTVTKLDRVVFAGLTKKDLPRGKWRFLTQKEVNHLKMQAGG